MNSSHEMIVCSACYNNTMCRYTCTNVLCIEECAVYTLLVYIKCVARSRLSRDSIDLLINQDLT